MKYLLILCLVVSACSTPAIKYDEWVDRTATKCDLVIEAAAASFERRCLAFLSNPLNLSCKSSVKETRCISANSVDITISLSFSYKAKIDGTDRYMVLCSENEIDGRAILSEKGEVIFLDKNLRILSLDECR